MYEDIKDGDIRIFPYYKDTYIGNCPFGYIKESEAYENMNIPINDVYAEFGGEKAYNDTHSFFENISEFHQSILDKHTNEYHYIDNYYTEGLEPIYKTYVKPDVWENAMNDYLSMVNEFGGKEFYKDSDYVNRCIAFEKKYKMFPILYTNYDEFYKMRNDLRKKVVFRKGIIHYNIEFK